MSSKDINAAEARWLEAFNGGDASGVANLYAAGARLLPPNSEIVDGRSDIEGFVKGFIQTGAQLQFIPITVHETPDLCVSVGRYVMDFPADSGAPQDRGKFIEVWDRQPDGSWLLVDDIFNSDLPAPSA
jgi:uncharacterized protein (TIGR02246 family)